jgi:hypothetical protein
MTLVRSGNRREALVPRDLTTLDDLDLDGLVLGAGRSRSGGRPSVVELASTYFRSWPCRHLVRVDLDRDVAHLGLDQDLGILGRTAVRRRQEDRQDRDVSSGDSVGSLYRKSGRPAKPALRTAVPDAPAPYPRNGRRRRLRSLGELSRSAIPDAEEMRVVSDQDRGGSRAWASQTSVRGIGCRTFQRVLTKPKYSAVSSSLEDRDAGLGEKPVRISGSLLPGSRPETGDKFSEDEDRHPNAIGPAEQARTRSSRQETDIRAFVSRRISIITNPSHRSSRGRRRDRELEGFGLRPEAAKVFEIHPSIRKAAGQSERSPRSGLSRPY